MGQEFPSSVHLKNLFLEWQTLKSPKHTALAVSSSFSQHRLPINPNSGIQFVSNSVRKKYLGSDFCEIYVQT